MDEDRQQRLKKVTQSIIGLPTLPAVVTQLIGLIDNPKTSARNVAQLISADQALTAKILKLANSAFYGFPREIATVDLAVVVLGFETVKSLGLSVSVLERFSGGGDNGHFDRQKFWEHSIACGVAAKLLAEKLRYRVSGEAFAAGILHDIGKLILSQYFPADFKQIIEMVEAKDLYIGKAEEEVLGVTHADVCAWLAQRWNLPNQLEDAIKYHHAPGRAPPGHNELPSLIHLADFLCRRERIGDAGGERFPSLDPAALRAFGIHEEPKVAIRRIFGYGDELREAMESAEAFTLIAQGSEEDGEADRQRPDDSEEDGDTDGQPPDDSPDDRPDDPQASGAPDASERSSDEPGPRDRSAETPEGNDDVQLRLTASR